MALLAWYYMLAGHCYSSLLTACRSGRFTDALNDYLLFSLLGWTLDDLLTHRPFTSLTAATHGYILLSK
jgi:hypothetical protein